MSKGKGLLMKEPTCDVQCDHSRGEQNHSEAPHCLCGMCKCVTAFNLLKVKGQASFHS